MLPEEEEGGLGGGGGGAMSIGDPLASGASGGLGGGGGGGASLSGMLINDSASVSTELDQLINNMDGNGFVNEGTGEPGTVWDSINATAKDLPGTKIPATFQLKVDGSTLWANANATEHMGEYINRLGPTSGSVAIRSQSMLRSFSQAVKDAMKTWGSETPGRHFGTFGGWELGINTETGVIYHALMK